MGSYGLLRIASLTPAGWGGRIRTCDPGTKTRCLATWPRPNAAVPILHRRNARNAQRLYRTPCRLSASGSASRRPALPTFEHNYPTGNGLTDFDEGSL